MFVLSPLGDVSSFRRKELKNEVYLITEDKCIECSGVLLAARSPVISELLETTQNIPATEFSDNIPGLEDCLDLIYGSSIQIRDRNYKTICKFSKIFQIKEMMDGIFSWVTEDLDCEKFWKVYLELITLNVEKSAFIFAAKRQLSTNSDTFLHSATEICQGDNSDTSEAVTELLSEISDKRILSFMMILCETALENDPMTSSTTSSPNINKFIVSATSYIENYVKSDQCDHTAKTKCIQFLEKVSRVSSNVALVRKVLTVIININSGNLQPSKAASKSTWRLNCEILKKLIGQNSRFENIQLFFENTTEIHPFIVGEIVLERIRSIGSDYMSSEAFTYIVNLLKVLQSASKQWYLSFCKARNIQWSYSIKQKLGQSSKESPEEYLHYLLYVSDNTSILRDCIEKGDGTPINLPRIDLKYSDGMAKYAESVPAFRYNPNVVPQYGNIEGHWFILTENNDYLSFITKSQKHILKYISGSFVHLVYVP